MNQTAGEFKPRTAWASEEEEPFEHGQNDSGGGGGVGVEPAPKPVLSEAALYGLLGDITRVIEPQTEADPAAIYSQLVVAYGNSVGRRAFFRVEQSKHYSNIFLNLVGRSSKGRKGVALDYAKGLYMQADPFYLTQFASGLASGEGLIWAVRDPVTKTQRNKKNGAMETITIDGGAEDKRLLVTETEFARPLRVMARPNNILSAVIREAWDNGDLRTLVKGDPNRATDAHISIIGHITREDLAKELVECDLFNGFANRFLWAEVERSRLLPEGGQIDTEVLSGLALRLRKSLNQARVVERMTRDPEAREHWHSIYADLSTERPGMLGAVTNRAEAQVLRISLVLALTDGSPVITLAHQLAAVALWDYCLQSARRLFGHRLFDSKAQKILEELRRRPQGMTRKQISEEIFGRNLNAERLGLALRRLLECNLVRCVIEPTGGRDAERWFAITP
jgi:Protein of unknown function (DUF3987)